MDMKGQNAFAFREYFCIRPAKHKTVIIIVSANGGNLRCCKSVINIHNGFFWGKFGNLCLNHRSNRWCNNAYIKIAHKVNGVDSFVTRTERGKKGKVYIKRVGDCALYSTIHIIPEKLRI